MRRHLRVGGAVAKHLPNLRALDPTQWKERTSSCKSLSYECHTHTVICLCMHRHKHTHMVMCVKHFKKHHERKNPRSSLVR